MRVSFDEGNILTRDNDYAGWGFYLIFFYIPFNLKNVIFRFNFKRFHALRARYNFRTGYTRMIHQESAYVDKQHCSICSRQLRGISIDKIRPRAETYCGSAAGRNKLLRNPDHFLVWNVSINLWTSDGVITYTNAFCVSNVARDNLAPSY